MEGSNFLQIIFVVVAAGAGYIFGLMDGRFTSGMQKKQQERKQAQDEERERAAVPPPQEIPTMGIYLDEAQNPRVKLYGIPVLPQTMTADQRTQLVNLIVKIRPWIDAKAAPAPASPQPATPAPQPSAPAPAPATLTPPSAPKPISYTPAPPAPEPAPKLDPLRGARSFLQNAIVPQKEEAPAMGIMGMINTHLQTKLAGTQFASLGINLKDGPMGEVLVYIGSQKYDGIEAVPSAEIQAIIRAAIAEWNASR